MPVKTTGAQVTEFSHCVRIALGIGINPECIADIYDVTLPSERESAEIMKEVTTRLASREDTLERIWQVYLSIPQSNPLWIEARIAVLDLLSKKALNLAMVHDSVSERGSSSPTSFRVKDHLGTMLFAELIDFATNSKDWSTKNQALYSILAKIGFLRKILAGSGKISRSEAREFLREIFS